MPYETKNSHPNAPMARDTTAAARGLPPQLASLSDDRSTRPSVGLAHINATMVDAMFRTVTPSCCIVRNVAEASNEG